MNSNRFCRFGLSVVLIVLAAAFVCPAADDDANSATEEEVSAAIEQIRAAEKVRDASAAYAGVARRAMKSVELRDVYVRKLVELGNPDLAYSAVTQLVKIDGENTFALSVLGYCRARRGEYGPAIGELAQAAKLGASDDPTMENLGQLVAHLDNDPRAPTLTDEASLAVAAGKADWANNVAYQRGYDRMSSGFDAYAAAETELKTEIEALKTKAVELEAEINSLNAELRSIASERQRLQDDSSNNNVGGGDIGGGVGDDEGGDGDSSATIPAGANDPNSEALQALYEREGEVYAAINQLEVELRGLGKEHRDAKRRLERLPRERRSIMRDAKAEFAFVQPTLPVPVELTALEPIGDTPAGDGQQGGAIIIDNDDADKIAGEGEWMVVAWDGTSHGPSLLHDDNANKGVNAIGFLPDLPAAGEYDVYMYFPAADFTATNVPVEVIHAGGATAITVNQRTSGGQWLLLGRFTFNQGGGGAVIIRTTGTDGHVFADAVKFQPVSSAPEAQETPAEQESPATQE